MTDRILSAVFRELRAREASRGYRTERVTVGGAAILVELAGGAGGGETAEVAGLAHRPPGDVPASVSEERSPVELVQQGLVTDETPDEPSTDAGVSPLSRAVGVATLNALSAPHVAWRTGDPMALLDPDVETVVTVGLFRPALRKFADVEVHVVERRYVDADSVSAPESVTLRSFTPDETATAMEGADVVFVTGSTLIYGGIEGYLEAVPATATTVVVGATASLLPGPLFDAGVDVVAGAAVDDASRAREAFEDGACGTDLHDHGVRKGYVVRGDPAGIDLQSEFDHVTE